MGPVIGEPKKGTIKNQTWHTQTGPIRHHKIHYTEEKNPKTVRQQFNKHERRAGEFFFSKSSSIFLYHYYLFSSCCCYCCCCFSDELRSKGGCIFSCFDKNVRTRGAQCQDNKYICDTLTRFHNNNKRKGKSSIGRVRTRFIVNILFWIGYGAVLHWYCSMSIKFTTLLCFLIFIFDLAFTREHKMRGIA